MDKKILMSRKVFKIPLFSLFAAETVALSPFWNVRVCSAPVNLVHGGFEESMRRWKGNGRTRHFMSFLTRKMRMMPEESVQSLKMLYCYASEDRQWPKERDLQLSNLKRQCPIISQFDGELFPNAERKEQLLAQLSETDFMLLLVSRHVQKVEAFWDEISHEVWAVQWLGGCRGVVLLRESVDWNHAPFCFQRNPFSHCRAACGLAESRAGCPYRSLSWRC
jgi:hypothetical protein